MVVLRAASDGARLIVLVGRFDGQPEGEQSLVTLKARPTESRSDKIWKQIALTQLPSEGEITNFEGSVKVESTCKPPHPPTPDTRTVDWKLSKL